MSFSELLGMSSKELLATAPYLVICFSALMGLLLAVNRVLQPRWILFIWTVLSTGLGLYAVFTSQGVWPVFLFKQTFLIDAYSGFFNGLFLVILLAVVCISFRYLDYQKLNYPDYYILLLLATFGMMVLSAALDLVVIFIALEILSLSTYVLVGFRRMDRRSNEAAIKYFILGSLGSAILLYGIALIYGSVGTTHVLQITQALQRSTDTHSFLFLTGFILVFSGLFLKSAIFPFQLWAPDVYEGAMVPITGFMSTGIKASVFSIMIRLFMQWFSLLENHYNLYFVKYLYFWFQVSALATLLIGNLIALTQVQLKRLLAYSSIAHSGYLLMGLLVVNKSQLGLAPVLFYLGIYVVVNLGLFSLLTLLAGPEDSGLTIQNLSGLAKRSPWLSFSFAVFLFSLAGLPPTAGFLGKYLLFYSGIQGGYFVLVGLAILGSLISVYYYLRVVGALYLHPSYFTVRETRVPISSSLCLIVLLVAALYLGIYPSKFADHWIRSAVQALEQPINFVST